MTPEEKAKVYLEDLKKAKDLIEKISTELKESEDERIRKELYAVINDLVLPDEQKERFNAWLEKQKEPENVSTSTMIPSCWEEESFLQKEPDGTWTEEDDANVKIMCEEGYLKPSERAWLKELKNRIVKKEQKPLEWSEEDEAMRDNILRVLSCFFDTSECDSNPSLSTLYPAYQKEMDWLKSLRFKPHWKPSEEQMATLLRAEGVVRVHDTKELAAAIAQLYEQLKKLM